MIDESIDSQVIMGNNSQVQMSGIGIIFVSCISGRKLIHKVMFVLGLVQNLLSLGQLLKKGYYAMLYNNECLIYDKRSMELMYSVKKTKDKIFPIIFSQISVNAFKASGDDLVL